MQKFSQYKEEFDINKVGAMMETGYNEDFCINIKGTDYEKFLKYVPSFQEEDKEKFEILGGYLCYVGTDEYEKSIADSVGMTDELSQEVFDSIGKEFAHYIETWEKAKQRLPNGELTALEARDDVEMTEEYRKMADIPDEKYIGEFLLDRGYIVYLGTNENRLRVLAISQYIKSYLAEGKFFLRNYIPPEKGTLSSLSDGRYKINDWIIEITDNSSVIKKATIVAYVGNQVVLNIPDTFNVEEGSKTTMYSITGIKGYNGKNIFQNDLSSKKSVQKVVVAKGISSITEKGLANLGNNIQVHIQYVGKDLKLGNDASTTNILGYEGIENSCGSFTFVAPSTGNYKFKLWGASGGDGSGDNYIGTVSSESGLGGYSEGTITLDEEEKIYCYIGGKGVYGTDQLEDGSGGYNGGGAGETKNAPGYGGGGATDIRYGTSTVSELEDGRILVAGGGGGADNYQETQARGTADDRNRRLWRRHS